MFDRIDRELRTQYLLGYYPRPAPPPGSDRHVQLNVKGNYVVRYRKEYFTGGEPIDMTFWMSPSTSPATLARFSAAVRPPEEISYKGEVDLVTESDRRSEATIVNISHGFSESAIVAEEGQARARPRLRKISLVR